jgi:hypothetical protein
MKDVKFERQLFKQCMFIPQHPSAALAGGAIGNYAQCEVEAVKHNPDDTHVSLNIPGITLRGRSEDVEEVINNLRRLVTDTVDIAKYGQRAEPEPVPETSPEAPDLEKNGGGMF